MRRGFALKANPLLCFDTNLNSSFQKDSKRSKISTFINIDQNMNIETYFLNYCNGIFMYHTGKSQMI